MRFRKTAFLLLCLAIPAAASAADRPAIDSYVAPFAKTNNFSGVVLIASNGRAVYSKAFGFADREGRIPNSLQTRFHVASMSMQFTAAAVLRLVDSGKLALDTPVDDLVPD